MEGPVLDEAALAALEEDLGGPEVLAEVLDAFLGETPILLAEVREALDAGDAARANRLAHSLKSNAAGFGAMRASEEAAALERAARSDPEGARRALARLDAEWARARPALEARRRSIG